VKRVSVDIPDWLYKAVVWVVLLYRRVRYGYRFRKIKLKKGKFAMVDPEDYERLSRYKWHLSSENSTYYAQRSFYRKKTKSTGTTGMHREVLRVPAGFCVDHINRNTLDNRKANLRCATASENSRNRRPYKNVSSKYRGVSFNRQLGKFMVFIGCNRENIYLGCFDDEIAAAKVYDAAVEKYHGEFGILNFPVRPKLPKFRLFNLSQILINVLFRYSQ